MERLLQDLRFALRLLWKDRGFTLTTVATLALCVAANTAIFAVVHSVPAQATAIPAGRSDGDHFQLLSRGRGASGVEWSSRLLRSPRAGTAFEEIAMYRTTGMTIGGQGTGEIERISAMQVTPSFFRLLQSQPLRGQVFTEKEAEVGHDKKVVLSYGMWQRLFGCRDDALGRDLRMNGVLYSIVGVMPDDVPLP